MVDLTLIGRNYVHRYLLFHQIITKVQCPLATMLTLSIIIKINEISVRLVSNWNSQLSEGRKLFLQDVDISVKCDYYREGVGGVGVKSECYIFRSWKIKLFLILRIRDLYVKMSLHHFARLFCYSLIQIAERLLFFENSY